MTTTTVPTTTTTTTTAATALSRVVGILILASLLVLPFMGASAFGQAEPAAAPYDSTVEVEPRTTARIVVPADTDLGITAATASALTPEQAEAERREARAEELRGQGLTVSPDGVYALPIPSPAYRLTSTYGTRTAPCDGCATRHEGVDLAATTGTPVHAVAAGTVIVASRHGDPTRGLSGQTVVVRHPDATETTYNHMSRIDVSLGQQVEVGEVIGAVGATGRVTGPHLHLGARVDGHAVDPAPWLAERGIPL